MIVQIITLSGASGSGKSSYCRELLALDGRFSLIESHTTRDARSKDLPGEYVHVGPEFFRDRADEFLWTLDVHGHTYGTLRRSVRDCLGRPERIGVMLIVPGCVPTLREFVNAQGADILHFHCLSPSVEKLRERFGRRIIRGDMTQEEAERRIADCATADIDVRCSGIPYLFVPSDVTIEQAARHILDTAARLRGK